MWLAALSSGLVATLYFEEILLDIKHKHTQEKKMERVDQAY